MKTRYCKIHGIPLTPNGKWMQCERCDLAMRYAQAPMPVNNANAKPVVTTGMKQRANIPYRYLTKNFDSYKAESDRQQNIISGLQTIIEKGTSGAFLSGNMGTGKTHIATAVLTHYLGTGKSGLYTTLLDIIMKIKGTWSKASHFTEEEVVRYYSSFHALVIDEIGVQMGTTQELMYLSKIIDNRYNYLRPTFLIGNLTLQELTEVIGERSIRRILENGRFIVFDWEPYITSQEAFTVLSCTPSGSRPAAAARP